MEFEQRFTIPVPAPQAWAVLLDIERIAPCMPGMTLGEPDGEEFRGKVKVKVGPMTVTYSGTARIIQRDETVRRAVIEASGKELRGAGTARATITGTVAERGDQSEVEVHTELAITGRPAQFGRGVMADVADKLLGQFAECLADELATDRDAANAPPEPGTVAEAAAPATPGAAPRPRPGDEAIDLLGVAGAPVLRRLAPVLLVLAGVLVVWWRRRRR